MRAQLQNVPVILATATPAIETRVQVERGRYAHLELPSRYGGAELPTIEAVDMRRFPPPPGRWLSPPLVRALVPVIDALRESFAFDVIDAEFFFPAGPAAIALGDRKRVV